MNLAGSLDYAQARLQARHGDRLRTAAVDWQRIETVRDLAALLDAARSTALRPWLLGITAGSSSHEIEATLRGRWRDLVAEVAGWMPPAWQPAVVWCAVLPDLAALQHLARGETPAPWLLDDPDWRPLAGDGHGIPAPAAADAPAGPAAEGGHPAGARAPLRGVALPLADAWRDPAAIGRAWRREWHRRWPPMPAAARQSMADLEAVVATHITHYVQGSTVRGAPARQAQTTRLARLWRRVALQPAAAFVHLALVALDLQRLRGELLRRRLFARWSPA